MVDGLVKKKVVVGYKCPKSYMSLLKEGLESWNEELNEEYENRPVQKVAAVALESVYTVGIMPAY